MEINLKKLKLHYQLEKQYFLFPTCNSADKTTWNIKQIEIFETDFPH